MKNQHEYYYYLGKVVHQCGATVKDFAQGCTECSGVSSRKDTERVDKAIDEAWERNRLRPEY